MARRCDEMIPYAFGLRLGIPLPDVGAIGRQRHLRFLEFRDNMIIALFVLLDVCGDMVLAAHTFLDVFGGGSSLCFVIWRC